MLGSENSEMVYSVEQDTFIVMSYYRNETFVNGECVYSVTACQQEYLYKYRDLIIQNSRNIVRGIRDVINRFVRTGSVDKEKSPGKPSVFEDVVDDLTKHLGQDCLSGLKASTK